MHELHLLCPRAQVETVSDALMELEALSVSIEDADADSPDEVALYGEPGSVIEYQAWQRSSVKALFDSAAHAHESATLLLAQDWAQDIQVVGLAVLADQDWVRLTQAQFPPIAITPQFWIVPSWHEAPPQAHKILRLDPGQAFGTGTHPTTNMCLRWIAEHSPAWTPSTQILDYGCGSGILAIACALHGATTIDAIDIDPASVKATQDNARHNQVSLRLIALPEQLSAQSAAYDLVLANILATPLKLLAPMLCARLQPGAQLLLAGILERQADELKQVYAQEGLTLKVQDCQDGWVLMTGAAQPAT